MKNGRPFYKLTINDLKKIKHLHLQKISKSALARRFKVDRSTIIYHLKRLDSVVKIHPEKPISLSAFEKERLRKMELEVRQNMKRPKCPDFLRSYRGRKLVVFIQNYGGFPKNPQEWNMFLKNYGQCFPHWTQK